MTQSFEHGVSLVIEALRSGNVRTDQSILARIGRLRSLDIKRPPSTLPDWKSHNHSGGTREADSIEPAMEELRLRVLACSKCPHLVEFRQNVVFGVGSLEADLMFVGEAPGAEEDRLGQPFVGRAGQLLTRIIETMGFARSEVYIANVLKCRPDIPEGSPGNRAPNLEEMQTCLPYLREQIHLIQPKAIVALGGVAMRGLFNATAPMKDLRGQWRKFGGIPVMATFHPSFLLRNQALTEKRKVWEDMLQVLEFLGRPVSERQQNFFLSNKSL
ncbi:MAG: uracil-DNA glycosylase [Verrucomicrobia bacterium]|nr:uracil-DNA glycosylase [Verrucomicrobiota bacterium]